jgi:hypothetical protein
MNRRAFLVRSSGSVLAVGSVARGQSQGTITVGDERLRVLLEWGSHGLNEKGYIVDGEAIAGVRGIDTWRLEVDGAILNPTASRCERRESGDRLEKAVSFEGRSRAFRWELEYRITGPGRLTKRLRILFERDTRLREARLWNAESAAPPLIGRTRIQEFAAFYRDRERGLFVSLDFPYSRVRADGQMTVVGYRPDDPLTTGEWYECHSLTLGATRLVDHPQTGFDRGEIAAFDAYVQNHRPTRFDRPMNIYASIVNRYTQVRDGIVFYSMKDQPTLAFHTDLVERDLVLMPKLGMEYYQVFPGAFEWPSDNPRSEIDRLVRKARDRGLRIGDYSATTRVYSPHFNIGNNRLNRPEWLVRNARLEAVEGTYCFGNSEFERYYSDTVVSNCRRYGFELHCLDLLKLVPCYASGHGHPPGPDSLYHQVRGLLRMISSVNAVSPQMLTWPNSGDWLEILPKLAWYSPNLYLTDPFIETSWQGLNMTRLLDDSRREQMISLHHSSLLPYRFFTNCQYFFSQNSIVPDIRNFEYGALSTLAVTPNLCLGEFRPWMDTLSPSDQERVVSFYQRWTGLVGEHYPLWKHTHEGGECPGFGAAEVYGHTDGKHGFVFLVNPNYWDRVYEIGLDATLGFPNAGACEITELYPVERLWLTAQGPWPQFGTKLPVNIPAQSVVVLEIRPAPEILEAPRLYGIPGIVDLRSGGYRVKTRGPQGRSVRFAVMLPPGSRQIDSAEVLDYGNQPDPRLSAPTPLKLVATEVKGAVLDLTFRREAAPTYLGDWTVQAADLDHGIAAGWNAALPGAVPVRFPLFVDAGIRMPLTAAGADNLRLGPAANFCGAYIEHAFSEDQETWIDLSAGGTPRRSGIPLASTDHMPRSRSLESVARSDFTSWWFGTTFELPFMYQIGAEPSQSEHTLAIFPILRAHQLRNLKAWVNGAELRIERYAYPRNRKLGCHYGDLVGSAIHGGKNQLVVFCRFDRASP